LEPISKTGAEVLKGFIGSIVAETKRRERETLIRELKKRGLHLGYKNDIIKFLETNE
jgi:hypothetical protein